MSTALVTGAGGGLGRALTEELAEHGYLVVATARASEHVQELADYAWDSGRPVVARLLDVADPVRVAAVVDQAWTRNGPIDLVVNNAGVGAFGPLEETSDAELRAVFDSNFFGAMNVLRAVVPGMRAARRGTIVNVSSVAARVPSAFLGAYAASKAALAAATESLAAEVAPFGVRTVIVESGPIATDIDRKAIRSARFDERSPYAPLHEGFQAVFRQTMGSVASPREAAAFIRAASEGDGTQLRYVFGEYARDTIARRVRQDATSWEQRSERDEPAPWP